MTGNILILGSNGMLGHALVRQLEGNAIGLTREECDLMNPDIAAILDDYYRRQPFSALINAAAYTQVDKAESEDSHTLMRINAQAPGEIAAWCKLHRLPMVHFSTDYVFDGSGTEPRREASPTSPINAYGASKLAGEQAVMEQGGNILLFRVCWIYDIRGKNFFTTIRRLLHEKTSISIVGDQFGAPTYAPHLASGVIAALEKASVLPSFPSGIYHLCSSGETSWHGFAHAIFELEKKRGPELLCQEVHAITSEQYPLPARRPHNSRLDCTRAHDVLGVLMPHWMDGLEECFKTLNAPE
jgi:dTDP-4-dehydrorhamnose reductase